MILLLFQVSYCKQMSFSQSISVIFRGLSVILLFKIAPKCSTEVLTGISKQRKIVVRLWRKCSLGKFCSGMSYDNASCEVNVNQSTMYTE